MKLKDKIYNSVPDGKWDLFLDIGLSYNAPVSYEQLKSNPNAFIIGFEPNPESCKEIQAEPFVKRHDFHVGGIPKSEKRFLLLNYGVANVNEVESRSFNITNEDPGCSSFLEIQSKHTVKQSIDINVIGLKYVLDALPWDKFNSKYFEIKSDTQGYEIEVLKSLGDYINYVKDIRIEESTYGQYIGAPSTIEIHTYLASSGMRLLKQHDGDAYFGRI